MLFVQEIFNKFTDFGRKAKFAKIIKRIEGITLSNAPAILKNEASVEDLFKKPD